MKNISEVVKSIKEARRNPEVNVKPSPGETAARAKAEFGEDRVIGVTMTHLEKVGINPRSDYNTPIGIYAYPYEWMMSKVNSTNTDWGGKRISSVLPFESEAPFITFFSLKPSANVLFLSDAQKKDQDEARLKLMDIFSKMGKYPMEKTQRFFRDRIDGELEFGGNDYVDSSYPGNVIWFMSYNVAKELSRMREPVDDNPFDTYVKKKMGMQYDPGQDLLTSYDYTSAGNDRQIQMLWEVVIGFVKDLKEIRRLSENQKAQLKDKLIKKISKSQEQRTEWSKKIASTGMTVIWNKVLRELGYDAIVDNEGTGVIHRAEPFQMVILNPKVIDKMIRVKNEPEPSGINSGAKEKIILNKLEAGTLNIPMVASILGLPKEKANAEYILNSEVKTSYSKISPFRAALSKYINNHIRRGSGDKSLSYAMDALEKVFGRYSMEDYLIKELMSNANNFTFKSGVGPKLVAQIAKYIRPENLSESGIGNLILIWNTPGNSASALIIFEVAAYEFYKLYKKYAPFKNWIDGMSESNPEEKELKAAVNRMIAYAEEFR